MEYCKSRQSHLIGHGTGQSFFQKPQRQQLVRLRCGARCASKPLGVARHATVARRSRFRRRRARAYCRDAHAHEPQQKHRDCAENRPHNRQRHKNGAYRHDGEGKPQDVHLAPEGNAPALLKRLHIGAVDTCALQPCVAARRAFRKQVSGKQNERRGGKHRDEHAQNAKAQRYPRAGEKYDSRHGDLSFVVVGRAAARRRSATDFGATAPRAAPFCTRNGTKAHGSVIRQQAPNRQASCGGTLPPRTSPPAQAPRHLPTCATSPEHAVSRSRLKPGKEAVVTVPLPSPP